MPGSQRAKKARSAYPRKGLHGIRARSAAAGVGDVPSVRHVFYHTVTTHIDQRRRPDAPISWRVHENERSAFVSTANTNDGALILPNVERHDPGRR